MRYLFLAVIICSSVFADSRFDEEREINIMHEKIDKIQKLIELMIIHIDQNKAQLKAVDDHLIDILESLKTQIDIEMNGYEIHDSGSPFNP